MSGLIRRSDMINAIETMPFEDYGDYERMIELIGSIPSADRPSGEWIDLECMDLWYAHVYQCSVCGREGMNWDYCPNCGARMGVASDE